LILRCGLKTTLDHGRGSSSDITRFCLERRGMSLLVLNVNTDNLPPLKAILPPYQWHRQNLSYMTVMAVSFHFLGDL